MKKLPIRAYFDNYRKWYPEKWVWHIKDNDDESKNLYMIFRARKAPNIYDNNDKLPTFDSVEKDAAQFDLTAASVTDFFGIKWEGTKSTYAYAGDPDYEQHLYYHNSGDDDDEMQVSDKYTQRNPPSSPDWVKLDKGHFVKMWLDIKNITDVDLHWIKENHLHKDSYIEVVYDGKIKYHTSKISTTVANKDHETVYDIVNFICALRKAGKTDLYNKLVAEEEKHFDALRTSSDKDEVIYAPKKQFVRNWEGKNIWVIADNLLNPIKEEFASAAEYYDWNYNVIYGK